MAETDLNMLSNYKEEASGTEICFMHQYGLSSRVDLI